MVTVRFYVGEDQEQSLVKVYDKLASGLDRMPPDATPPLIKVRTIDDVPVLRPDPVERRLRRLRAAPHRRRA